MTLKHQIVKTFSTRSSTGDHSQPKKYKEEIMLLKFIHVLDKLNKKKTGYNILARIEIKTEDIYAN